ncbi:calpastatin isoform X29 [Anguilla rostrata]|uniref:calpastatin isoform X29 n=1 Tax=Anguilla rostrata TaxID=7938 RepID=UPI0030CBABF5
MPHNKKKKHSRHGKPKGAAQAAKAAQAAPAGVAASEGPAPDGGAEGVEVGPHSPTAAPEATSQQKQPTSAPVGLASTGKPAEFEKAATSPAAAAAKPAATTAAAGAAAAATAAVKQVTPGAATAPKESPKPAKAPASPSKAKPFNAAAGAAVQPTSPKETPKESPKTTPIASSKGEPAKTEPAKLAVGADKAAKPADNQGKPQDVKPKESPKSSPISPTKGKPVKGEPAAAAEAAAKKGKPEEVTPKETAKTKPSSLSKVEPSKPVAGAADVLKGKPKPGKPQEGSKIQVEVVPIPVTKSADKPVVDPFDALADSLPSEAPAPTAPVYTGPEVTEHGVTSEKGILCGEDERTLPPGYRFEDMGKNIPDLPEVKPTKPLSTDEALDSLSLGFESSPPPSTQKKEPKVEDVSAIDALSAGFSNFAPPPPSTQKEIQREKETNKGYLKRVRGAMVDSEEKVEEKVTASASSAGPLKSAAPPADKKAKLEKGCEDFSLKGAVESPKAPANKKPATDESMSLDALSALGDLLPDAEPVPEPPKIRPEDMVKVDELKSEEAVRVGEREDTLPPDYRFKEEDRKHLPPPKIEPSLDAGEALDILAGGFDAPAVAPTVQAPLPPSTKAPKQPSKGTAEHVAPPSGKVSTCYAAPPGVKMPPVQPVKKPVSQPDSDFSLDALVDDVVAPTTASAVQGAPQLSDASDAMDALSDTLKDIAPAPAPAPVPVKDVVKEKKVVEEKVIKMGERDDTLPPGFQLTEKERKEMEKEKAKSKADVRPKKKSIDDDAALDLLSGDFSTPAAPAAPAAVAASAAPKTQSAACPAETMPGEKGPVLDALSSTLLPDTPGFRPKQSPVGEKPKQSPVGDKPKQSPVGDKPKAKSGKSKSRSKKQAVADTSAVDELSGQLGSDVVSTSPAKKSSKS